MAVHRRMGFTRSGKRVGKVMKQELWCALVLLSVSDVAMAQNQSQQLWQQQQQVQQQQDQQRRNTEGWLWSQNQADFQESEPAPARERPTHPPMTEKINRPGHWTNTWGAVADGSNGLGAGSSGDHSRADAEHEAVKKCTEAGGVECRPVFVYFGQCVALAHPGGRARAETLEQAESLASKICKEHNPGDVCKIVFTDCARPIWQSD